MSRLADYLDDYGTYHQDERNELTHLIGIPLIVLSVVMLSSNLVFFTFVGATFDLGWLLIIAVTAFYLTLDKMVGAVMGFLLAGLHFIGSVVFGRSIWFSVVLFIAGWALQFIGHRWEGKRPAFMRNAVHLLIGPLWIVSRLMEKAGVRIA